ncbi:hypothetical protein SZMC14600_22183, partial [Saccharomonospora azurea SZMC 14600]|uniref:hypothetical protein n=1 Tax=Saccharomonospora azurea TaxID=40988 RepID=UPI00023FF978
QRATRRVLALGQRPARRKVLFGPRAVRRRIRTPRRQRILRTRRVPRRTRRRSLVSRSAGWGVLRWWRRLLALLVPRRWRSGPPSARIRTVVG